MSLPPRFLDEIRSRLTLSEVIGRRVKVTRAGRESKACCPFHHEKTPSFTISDDKQFYHCFGCGAHGDVINFVMQHDNISFIDAVEMLAAEAGLQVPRQSPQEVKKAQKQKDIYALVEDAATFFEQTLRDPKYAESLSYLKDRGLSDETISSFRLGFAPDNGQHLRDHLKGLGYQDKDMIEAGLVKTSKRGGSPYAFFRDRIMFPVSDRRGRVVAFGGRILPEHLRPPQRGDYKPPKYINSSETPIFHKGRVLYGESKARMAAADGLTPVVVEGYLDVIACEQAGIRGSVAPMGTALTEEQILLLWKMIPGEQKVPLLCFDGDNAGRKAAARVCSLVLPLLQPGMSVNFAFLPEGEDPDTLVRSGGAGALQKILGAPVTLFDFLWGSHVGGRKLETPESRAGVTQSLQNEVARIENRDVQTHYSSLLRRRISETFFPRRPFKKGYGKEQAGKGGQNALRLRAPSMQINRIYPRVLLAALINHPQIFGAVEEALAHMHLADPLLVRIRNALLVIMNEESEIEREALLEQLKNEGFLQETGDILNESVYVHASFCSPSASPDEVEGQWLAYWKDGCAAGLENEIKSGWKRAFQGASEEEEEKLRHMVSMKSSESG